MHPPSKHGSRLHLHVVFEQSFLSPAIIQSSDRNINTLVENLSGNRWCPVPTCVETILLTLCEQHSSNSSHAALHTTPVVHQIQECSVMFSCWVNVANLSGSTYSNKQLSEPIQCSIRWRNCVRYQYFTSLCNSSSTVLTFAHCVLSYDYALLEWEVLCIVYSPCEDVCMSD